jgi:2-iminobutanoate/2-iminopropanoate deaminase
MDRKSINSSKVARGGTMYNQAVKVGNTLYISGQVAYDLEDRVVGKGDIEAQTRQVFENMKALLESAGMSFDDVMKINVYLTELGNRPGFHKVRQEYFQSDRLPASTLVIVKGLISPDLLVEVEAVAVR